MTRSEFLKANIANYQRILREPVETYPNGRTSHDVARERLNRTQEQLADYGVERGLMYADGTFAGYDE